MSLLNTPHSSHNDTQFANPFANWLITLAVDSHGPRLLARCSHGHQKDEQTFRKKKKKTSKQHPNPVDDDIMGIN